jgi:hypothetical protein
VIAELWNLFLKLSDGLDSHYVTGKLDLFPNGTGVFYFDEHRVWTQMKYPRWAKSQRNQAGWNSLAEGIEVLKELVNRKELMG